MGVILLLAGAGFLLLLTEMFLPGGVLGLLGALALLAAVVLGYAQFGALTGTALLAVLAFVTLVGFGVWMKVFPRTAVGRRLTLERVAATPGLTPADGMRGLEGVALTPLRPAGKALVGEKRVDVVTDGTFVERNAPIVVVATEGTRIVVREKAADDVSGEAQTSPADLPAR